ncbi:MAG: hypothetical protein M1827_001641 [Pycnora praestabilis]|nr:MAG: hypothetical protein M1827_001641 [Pycnora praestabilis]
MPERIQREGNGLEIACRKFRMAAHLWQAFTAEQMHRNKLGRRSFRFEEEWQTGTLSYRDRETAQMRNETRIHVVRMDKTVQEVGELAELQRGELHNVAKDAIQAYFRPMPCQKQYVSALVLDVQSDIILDPSADNTLQEQLGGEINLAIFGSHSLQNYPSSIDEIVPAFSDCTRTSMEYVANGDNGSGSNWESANVAMAAQLRATGRIFGCPYEESGIMSHEIVQFNRTFTCKEPYSTRTKSPGIRLCLPKDEAVWHRLDCLRFRHHPCFRIPVDQGMNSDGSVQVWPVENGNVIATATTGIAFIEILTEGDDTCRYFIDYIEGSGNGNGANGPSRQILLTEGDIRARTPEDRKKERLKLIVHSAGQGKYVIEDFRMLASKSSTVKLPNGRMGFRGIKLGMSQIEGSQPQQMMLDHFMLQTKLLTQIKVYYGFAVAGIEFVCEDFTSQLFGQRGGQMSEFLLGESPPPKYPKHLNPD